MSIDAGSSQNPALSREGAFTRFLRATEIDSRMVGMVGALLLIWVGFHLAGIVMKGQGLFLTPRNLWNLLTQASSISIMATGMVLIIVMRHIDLSVGSILGLVAIWIGFLQANFFPAVFGVGSGWNPVLATVLGIALGVALGAFHGWLVAYAKIPSFVVTLGGLLIWRNVGFLVAGGETIAPMDPRYALIGGGPYGSIGSFWSWVVGALACAGIIWGIHSGRVQRTRFKFPLRPMWAEATVGGLGCAAVLAAVLVVNAYPWPVGIIKQYAAANNIAVPEGGLFVSHGFAVPVLIAIAVGLVMTFLATRTQFGRYVYAIGGNPEAAELAGINTRRITVLAFALMGLLAAISAIVQSARLNAATIALGQFDELYVIAAAVIGGTSLAGGSGTIFGAFLGALIMQSIQSGMALLGFDTTKQYIALGIVLVFSVWLDTMYRSRIK